MTEFPADLKLMTAHLIDGRVNEEQWMTTHECPLCESTGEAIQRPVRLIGATYPFDDQRRGDEHIVDCPLCNVALIELKSLFGLMFAAIIVIAVVRKQAEYNKLWITSPTGKTTVELPFYQALRIIRKRRWELTRVVPVKPPLTKWQHLKLALVMRI